MEGFPGGCGSAGPDTAVMDLTESIALCKGLEERGAHYILQSAGTRRLLLHYHSQIGRYPTTPTPSLLLKGPQRKLEA
jgi:hypothetical protein